MQESVREGVLESTAGFPGELSLIDLLFLKHVTKSPETNNYYSPLKIGSGKMNYFLFGAKGLFWGVASWSTYLLYAQFASMLNSLP